MPAGNRSKAKVQAAAKALGLRLVAADALSIRRRRCGTGFLYRDAAGRTVSDRATLDRIRSLAIPPAYTDVRIADRANMHLQAIGTDEAGRPQHRYHPDWVHVREKMKVHRLSRLVEGLPALRAAVARDLKQRQPTLALAIAAAVALIDVSFLRVGCEAYARSQGGRGVATLLKRHVKIHRDRIDLHFHGKGGRDISCTITDRPLLRALRRLAKLPGPRMFQYCEEDGTLHSIRASDVNRYLKAEVGEAITAKDLRTLGASATAVEHFLALEPATSETKRKRQLAGVMRRVAEVLSNTPAVTRKSYVHEAMVQGHESGALTRLKAKVRGGFRVRRAEKIVGRLAARFEREAIAG